jgi:hypothetical protein
MPTDTLHASACELKERPAGFERVPVELGDCDVLIVSCGLIGEFEKPKGIRPEHWPPAARARVEAEAEKFIAAHPDRVVRLVSFGASSGACFLVMHHAPKASA